MSNLVKLQEILSECEIVVDEILYTYFIYCMDNGHEIQKYMHILLNLFFIYLTTSIIHLGMFGL